MSDIKNMPYGNNSRLDTTEENTSELEDMAIDTIQIKA